MNHIGNNIPSSKTDDDMLTSVTKNVYEDIKSKYLCSIPDNWNFECGQKRIQFNEIKTKMINAGIAKSKAKLYYGGDNCIITDAHILYLTMNCNNEIDRKPIFIGEMKRQGTNDQRIVEGKKKQSIGNAGTDRVAKNFYIAADYCYLCDPDVFPYTVFLHGCDFNDSEITSTTKSKLQPLFGKLNMLNPYFDRYIPFSCKGGSCFFQGEDYTYKRLYEICFKCCEMVIEYYILKYSD